MKRITMFILAAVFGLTINTYSQIDSPFGPGVIPFNICGSGNFFPTTYWSTGYMTHNAPQGFPANMSGYEVKFSEHRITQINGLPAGVTAVTDVMSSAGPGAPYGVWVTGANGIASGTILFDVELGSINNFLTNHNVFTAIISVEHKLSEVVDNGTQTLVYPSPSGPFQYGGWYPYGAVNGDGIAPLSPFSINVYSQDCVFGSSVSTTSATCSYTADGSATITVTGAQFPITYSVNNGLTSTTTSSATFTVSGLAPGQYTIVGKDSNFKLFRHTFTVGIQQHPDIIEPICMVAVDEVSGKNMVVWEPSGAPNVSGYNIYKLSNLTSTFELIGTVDSSQIGIFIDTAGNPHQSSAQYALSTIAVKVCETTPTEGPLSVMHQTLHLSANLGVNNEVNLIWNAYQGFSYPNFEIQRSTNGGTFNTIGIMANNFLSYTDMNPPQGTNYYRIIITKAGGCDPSKLYSVVRSNVVDGDGNPASVEKHENESTLTVYPNPGEGVFNVIYKNKYDISVVDFLGRTQISISDVEGDYVLNLSDRSSGMYLLLISQNGQVVRTQRIIKK